ncbi:MAG: proline--tRNA ligase [Candidatus Aenigmatarchaeota archaeon]
MSEELGITTKKEENFSEWYVEIIRKSELMDYSDVSGCMIFRPLAYSLWENVKNEVDKRFKEIGIENVYFPIFIPERLLEEEAEHFEGFSPEVAWVTETGSSELDERLAVRPTSEAIMYPTFSKWIRSWRDLPRRYNQWNNAVRWEFKHPTPFLRTREFLWNEGHNMYETEEEVMEDKERILDVYETVQEDFMALPGIMGRKTQKEKFAGAVNSYSIEHLMPDGKAIQGPIYHHDGQNFSEAYDIKFMDKDDEEQYVYQSTYAITTRQLGVMLSIHSDDKGLVIPPKITPKKTVVVPIFNEENREEVVNYAEKIGSKLEDFHIDDREGYTPGWKFNHWELRGVPLRIEIGPNELEDGTATLVRRDNGGRKEISIENLEDEVDKILKKIQNNLYEKAKNFLEENIREVSDYEELWDIIEERGGFVKASWCGKEKCENAIKEETGAKITNIPFKYDKPKEKCIYCGEEGKYYVHFAKTY